MDDVAGQAAPAVRIRETAVARVLTSTSIDKHPTAFFTTGLPVLQLALDVDAMTETLGPLLAPLGAGGAAPAIRYARLLAYKQGNRGIVNYELDRATAPLVVGKLFPDAARSARAAGIMQLLWSGPFRDDGTTDAAGVPRPLGHIPDLSMLVYVPASGAFFDEVCAEPGATDVMVRAGRWLATLHRSRLVLDRRFDLDKELVDVAGWALEIGRQLPEFATRAGRVAMWLKRAGAAIELETHVPVHKDFHHRHLLVRDDGHVTVIDLDEMRLGDPCLDVAHFVAHLHLMGGRTPIGAAGVDALERTFLEAYAGGTGWVPDERHPFFLAHSYLKMARQLATVRGVRPRPEAGSEEQAREIALVLDSADAAIASAGAA